MYLDLIIIFNFIINFSILKTTSILLKRKTKNKYLIISSILGIIPTLIYLINDIIIINIIDILFFSIIMSLIAFKYKNIIYTIKNIIYMYISSIFLGGTLYLISIKFNNIILEFFFLIILTLLISKIYRKTIADFKNNNSNYYKVCINYKEESINCIGFLDTGNKIIDPYHGYPVILLNKKLFSNNLDKYILVPYTTVSSSSILKCFKPDSIFIEGTEYKKKCLVALIETNSIMDYDLILNNKLLERI